MGSTLIEVKIRALICDSPARALVKAVTICASKTHFQLLPVAETMLKHFVDNYGKFYGQEYITSNVHNLIHVVDEVKRFGTLQSFNAYPFENKLSSIKRMIRKGNQPLQQIANRLIQIHNIEVET
ncbi:unnamed protein product [Parnassius apollo]|uniref:(apollo) hypothetical protein n=1 Tax=Parnassius apollo TaxID=110799 RepID=A0A8S3W671_PARAO|nr:unnamed protein product [Parnassius apollo]